MSARLLLSAALVMVATVIARQAHAEAPPPLEPDAEPGSRTAEDVIAENRSQRPAPWRVTPSFTVAAGVTTVRLLDLPFNGGQGLVGIAGELTEHLSVGGDLEYARTATPNGLLLQLVRPHVNVTFVLDRLRLGLGPHLTWLVITRETTNDTIVRVGVGLHALASVDLVRLGERGGLFLLAEPSIARVGPADAAAVDVALGARF